jgi:hypothetical protein
MRKLLKRLPFNSFLSFLILTVEPIDSVALFQGESAAKGLGLP